MAVREPPKLRTWAQHLRTFTSCGTPAQAPFICARSWSLLDFGPFWTLSICIHNLLNRLASYGFGFDSHRPLHKSRCPNWSYTANLPEFARKIDRFGPQCNQLDSKISRRRVMPLARKADYSAKWSRNRNAPVLGERHAKTLMWLQRRRMALFTLQGVLDGRERVSKI